MCAPVGSACSAGSITDVWFTVFDSHVQTGRVDLAVRGRGGGGCTARGADFVALDAAWEAEMGRRGLAPAIREAYGRVARSHLLFLEAGGYRSAGRGGRASVLAFLKSLLDRVGQVVAAFAAMALAARGSPHI